MASNGAKEPFDYTQALGSEAQVVQILMSLQTR